MTFLTKLLDFNSQLETTLNGGRYGILHAGRQPAFPFEGTYKARLIVIDHSFSMSNTDFAPTRLQAAKEASTEYVITLAEQKTHTRIGVISFGDDATIVVPLTNITDHREIVSRIDSISFKGCTDIGNALKQAITLLIPCQGQKSQIVLLTDGCGDCPLDIPKKLKTRYNATIDVVGIGGSPKYVDENLLRKIATTDPDGTNHYRFIGDARTLKHHYKQLATGIVWKGRSQ